MVKYLKKNEIQVREGVKKTVFLGYLSQMWVGGVADSQTRSKPLETLPNCPKNRLFRPKFHLLFSQISQKPWGGWVGGWENTFGKDLPKKTFFLTPSLSNDNDSNVIYEELSRYINSIWYSIKKIFHLNISMEEEKFKFPYQPKNCFFEVLLHGRSIATHQMKSHPIAKPRKNRIQKSIYKGRCSSARRTF